MTPSLGNGTPAHSLSVNGSISILHVDDQGDFVEMAAQILEGEHKRFDVEPATSASEGLERLTEAGFDCIVSDYQMPGMDGLEFLEAVREEYPDLPFILFTGKGSEEVASDAISAGVTDYLQKKSGSDQFTILANRIENAVHQTRAEHRLEESQRRFRTLLGNVPGMAYRCRNEPDWPMLFVSNGCAELTGYDPSKLVEGDISYGRDIIHPDDLDRVWESVQDALASREPFRLEYRIRTADDVEKWVWEQGQGVVEDGEIVALEGFIMDVTERKESKEQLQYQSSLLEAQMEATIDGQLVIDENRTVISYNDRFVDMWEIPDELIESKSDEALLDSLVEHKLAEPEAFMELIEDLYDHPEETSRDEIYLTDGRVFDRYSAPVIGDEGTNYGRLWTFRDITDRKERERELRQYRQVVEGSTDLLGAADLNENVLFVNEQYRKYHRLSDDDAINKSLEGVLEEEIFAEIKPYLERVYDGEEVRYEMERPGANGDSRTLDVQYYPLRHNNGEITGSVAAMRDITERKESERELQNLYQTYRDLFDGINDAVFVHKPDGQFLEVNEESIERYGYDEEELIDLTPQDIDAPNHAPHATDRIETIAEEGTYIFESVHVTKSGERIPVEISSSIIDYFGHEAVLSVARDITERKEYERDLEQANDQLRLVNRIVRHDIRNDMNLVLGWGQELEGHVDDEGEQMLSHILANGQHVVDLTKTLRDFMRAYEDKEKTEFTPTNIADVLNNEIGKLKERYPQAKVEIPEELPNTEVRANKLLTSVFWNLLQNAVKHSDKEIPRVKIEISADEQTVIVRIEDNGLGIPEEQRNVIFGKGESGLDDPNAGIGLYLVKTVVTQYEGDVWVEDNDPEGSVFVVELPTVN